jgi:hypothetical protein
VRDINSSGQVVGGGSRAFYYDATTGVVDLNTLIDPDSGWVLWEARAINDLGQIVGAGDFNGQRHAYLLTPVPEPSTFALAR